MESLESERGAAALFSPTGTGKTHVAAFTAAELRRRGVIDRVWVCAPNITLAESMERVLLRYGMHSGRLNHTKISRTVSDSANADADEADDGDEQEVAVLDAAAQKRLDALASLGPRDLLIVDEAHKAANSNLLHVGLAYYLGVGAPDGKRLEQRPRVLLLTATPYSTGVENLNGLLRLLGEPKELQAGEEQEVAALDCIVNVTLPWVMQTYGTVETDPVTGVEAHALAFPGDNGSLSTAYFPRLLCRNISYVDTLDPVYSAVEQQIYPGYIEVKKARLLVESLKASRAPRDEIRDAECVLRAREGEMEKLWREAGHESATRKPVLLLLLWLRMVQSSLPAIHAGLLKRKDEEPDRVVSDSVPSKRVNLDVSYKNKEVAKALGARWDAAMKTWYAPKRRSVKKSQLIELLRLSKPNAECTALLASLDTPATLIDAAADDCAVASSALSTVLEHMGLEDNKLLLMQKEVQRVQLQEDGAVRWNVLVFCTFIATATYLKDKLADAFPGAQHRVHRDWLAEAEAGSRGVSSVCVL